MTRNIEQIEADLAEARSQHAAAVQARSLAVTTAADLRRRAIAGDGAVTATALAEADHAAEFAALPIGARLEAVAALEAQLKVAETEIWADRVTATLPALRGDVEQAFSDIEAALDRLVKAWRLHATFVSQTARECGTIVLPNVTPRVRRGLRHVVVDGEEIRTIHVHEPLAELARRTHERLFAGNPKAQD